MLTFYEKGLEYLDFNLTGGLKLNPVIGEGQLSYLKWIRGS